MIFDLDPHGDEVCETVSNYEAKPVPTVILPRRAVRAAQHQAET
ncbi:hypothetical protein X566_02695 [Afipia sp. P52-10]|nr:hypothetical protein X566_02695 [Afipia sp. P52-10]